MIFLTLLLLSTSVFAETQPFSMANVSVENDVHWIGGPGTDHGYSQGLKFSHVKTTEEKPNWAHFFANETTSINFGLGASQKIFTPGGIENKDLTENDQPYAAWLSLSAFYHFQNEHQSHLIELNVGLIGPEAGGEGMQNTVHKAIDYKLAQGWRNQLATEPTLEISYQQRFRFIELNHSLENKIFDAMALYGGDFGNVLIDGYLGAMTRFGFDLPHDLGPTRPSLLNGDRFISEDDTNSFYVYGFAAARVIGVGRNIFLDGNTFKSSHRVNKKPIVVENEMGITINYQKVNLIWHFVTTSPQFEEKSEFHNFASVTLSYLL